MRLALIADTHGNRLALDAVLAEIDEQGIAHIVGLGDVAGLGPWSRETLARLRALACLVVMGNADAFLLDPALLDPARHPAADAQTRRLHDMERWAAAQLDVEDRAYIASFRPLLTVDLGDGATLLCYHGSPRSAWDEIRAATPDNDALAALLGEERALVLAGGHTHEQFVRRLDQSIILNPGSVGLPSGGGYRNPPWAEYAVLTVEDERLSVELRRVPVEVEAIRAALLASGMPHAVEWAADWR